MKRWLVAVTGEKFDLEELVYWFPDGDSSFVAEGDSVFLTGPRLDAEGEPKAVHETANAILDECCGVLKVLDPNFRPPRVDGIFREESDGRRTEHRVAKLVGAELRIKAGRSTPASRPTKAQDFLRLSRASPRLSLVCELWADDARTWPRLYRVVEELQMHIGTSPDREGLCSQNDLERFNRTANTAEIAGKDARHASGKFLPPEKPMSLQEGTEFVRRLIEQTLSRSNSQGFLRKAVLQSG